VYRGVILLKTNIIFTNYWTTCRTEGGETNDLTPANGGSLYITIVFPYNDIRFLRLLRKSPAAMLLQCVHYGLTIVIVDIAYHGAEIRECGAAAILGLNDNNYFNCPVSFVFIFFFSLISFRLRLRSPTVDYRCYHHYCHKRFVYIMLLYYVRRGLWTPRKLSEIKYNRTYL